MAATEKSAAKRPKGKGPSAPPRQLSLEELIPSVFVNLPDSSYFTGKIVTRKSYGPFTRIASIALTGPNKSSVTVQFKGPFASHVIEDLELGATVTFKTKGAVIKGIGKRDAEGWERYIVEFGSRVQGSLEKDGETQKFAYSKEEHSSEFVPKGAAPVAPERPSPDAIANISDTAYIASQDVEMEEEKRTVKVPVVRVPAPVAKAVVANAVASGSGARHAEEAAAGERKRKKARKEIEERDNWGFVLNSNVQYYPLKEEEAKKNIAFIAIATVKIPKAMEDDEWSITLLLYDPSIVEPQTVLITGRDEVLVPNVTNGDVILLRNVHRVSSVLNRGTLVRYSSQPHKCCVWKVADFADGGTPRNTSFALIEEVEYAARIARWWEANSAKLRAAKDLEMAAKQSESDAAMLQKLQAQIVPVGRVGRQLVTIKEMKFRNFCNILVEIQAFYAEASGYWITATDYSVNPNLQHTREGFPSPYRTLRIEMMGAAIPQTWAVNPAAAKGMLVHINNVLPKPDGSGLLEATCKNERRGRGGVLVESRDLVEVFKPAIVAKYKTQVDALRQRKREYEGELGTGAEDGPAMSVPQIPVIRAPPVPLVTLADASHPIAPLDDLTRAAENLVEATFHIKAKIYDIAPSAMESWVQASCFKCRAILPPSLVSCLDHSEAEVLYAWKFKLGLGRAEELSDDLIIVDVAGDSAAAFLDVPATASMRAGAHNSHAALAPVRARFGPLLGRLLERKKTGGGADFEDLGDAWESVVAGRNEGGRIRWGFEGTKLGGV